MSPPIRALQVSPELLGHTKQQDQVGNVISESDDDAGSESDNDDPLVSEWNSYSGEKNVSYVNQLALKHKELIGKWMPRLPDELVDEFWEKIAWAILEKGLGPHVLSAKVTTQLFVLSSIPQVSPVEDTRSHHLVCVYNDDYQDRHQVKFGSKQHHDHS